MRWPVACAILSLSLAACERVGSSPTSTLVVGRAGDALGLDPGAVGDAESVEVTEQIFEHLVRARDGGDGVEPELALRWERSDDGRIFTFALRPGVRFHDGTPLDARAVVRSFERQRTARTGAPPTLFRRLVAVEETGPLAVKLVLDRPYAPLLADLATFAASIVSPTAVDRYGAEFGDHPVGTGPFRFVEWVRGERITLAANADHWAGRPAVDQVVFVPVGAPRQRLIELEGGAIDVAESLAPEDLQFVSLHPQLTTLRTAGFAVGYLAMNLERAPFDDVRVRRAVGEAIHRSAIIQLVFQGLATVATGPLAPGLRGESGAAPPRLDPAEARRILVEAGVADPPVGPPRRPLRLFAPTTPRQYLPDPERVAHMVARDLADVGLDVEIVAERLPAHLAAVRRGDHDLCLLGWTSDGTDPDDVLSTNFHSDEARHGSARNVAFLRDPTLDGLLERAQAELDPSARARLQADAERRIDELSPWVPLAHAELVVAHRRGVTGLRLPPTGALRLAGVRLAPEPSP